MYGAIEAGGTKFVCAVSDENLEIIERVTIKTSTPDKTFKAVFKLFDRYSLKSIGIGSFGPINVKKNSTKYGYITSTPKKNWSQTDFVGVFKERYQVPIEWTTDVNAAALGEYTLGAAQDKKSCVYLTVGTGFGGGAIMNDQLLEAFNHPEMGHFYPRRHERDDYVGNCIFHGDCLEGLASGPAIEARYGISAKELAEDHEAWEIEAHYLAQAAMTYTTILRPECIIFGGGVMEQKHLFPKIYKKFQAIMADYLELPAIEKYILSPGLGEKSGILGSLLLAKRAYQNKR